MIAPHKMREHEGTLWVADIDQLMKVSRKSARVISKTTTPGVLSLRDVAIAKDGKVFVSILKIEFINTIMGK